MLSGAVVHTLDSANPEAEAVAIAGNRIVCVGTTAECSEHQTESTRALDLTGKTIVPGLRDSHAHLAGIGLRELELDLTGTPSLEDLIERVRVEADGAEPDEWIVGRGWIESGWSPPEFPTRDDLDRAAPKNPVWLKRIDGHAGVANSRALDLADVNGATPVPPGGDVLKDDQGRPTGMLIDRAQSLVQRHVPEITPERIREAILAGARRSLERGWTQISDAGTSTENLEILRELYAEGAVGLRVYSAMSHGDSNTLLDSGPVFEPLLTVRSIKLYLDGALGSRGAALIEPYSDADSAGLLMHEPDDLRPLLERALAAGIQIQAHAIGDRANRMMLDLYEQVFADAPDAADAPARGDPRWRIEHAQIIHPDDLPRFVELGVIPSMQASHAVSDALFVESRLGPDRLTGAYAWRTLVDLGAQIAGGSDAPVEVGDPFDEIHAAITRGLTREEALKSLTIWGAYSAFEEDELGTIEVGKKADLTVLSRDLFEVADEEIQEIEAVMTIVDGRVVYSR